LSRQAQSWSNGSAMRTLWFAFLVVITMPLAVSAQGPPDSSFVVRLQYMKDDLPNSSTSTCLTIFPDGRFHMGQLSEFPRSGPRVFEDSLPVESLKSLSTILEAQGLKDQRTVALGPVTIAHGEIVWALIPRGEATQRLLFAALWASAGQSPKPFPASLDPLVQWVQETMKAINQRKLRPLKNPQSADCWLVRQ